MNFAQGGGGVIMLCCLCVFMCVREVVGAGKGQRTMTNRTGLFSGVLPYHCEDYFMTDERICLELLTHSEPTTLLCLIIQTKTKSHCFSLYLFLVSDRYIYEHAGWTIAHLKPSLFTWSKLRYNKERKWDILSKR